MPELLLLLLLLHGWFLHLLLLFPSEVGYRKNPEAIRGALASTKNRTKVEFQIKIGGKTYVLIFEAAQLAQD